VTGAETTVVGLAMNVARSSLKLRRKKVAPVAGGDAGDADVVDVTVWTVLALLGFFRVVDCTSIQVHERSA
jgi:hypothetical protein